jgi:hypothetical protein
MEMAMKFYLEINPQFNDQQRAHIVADNKQGRNCVCSAQLKPEKWMLVEEISENVHLCKRCSWLLAFVSEQGALSVPKR